MRGCLSWKIDRMTEEAKRQPSQVCLSWLTNLKRSKRCRKRDRIWFWNFSGKRGWRRHKESSQECLHVWDRDMRQGLMSRSLNARDRNNSRRQDKRVFLTMSLTRSAEEKKRRTKNTRRWFNLSVRCVSHDKTHFMLPEVQTDKIHTTNNNYYWMKREVTQKERERVKMLHKILCLKLEFSYQDLVYFIFFLCRLEIKCEDRMSVSCSLYVVFTTTERQAVILLSHSI